MILLMKRFTLFSAGVGRTGTFIAIMVEMARIKSEKLVDIFNYVRYMRTRRPMMVMNEVSQYNCTLLSFLLYFYQ